MLVVSSVRNCLNQQHVVHRYQDAHPAFAGSAAYASFRYDSCASLEAACEVKQRLRKE